MPADGRCRGYRALQRRAKARLPSTNPSPSHTKLLAGRCSARGNDLEDFSGFETRQGGTWRIGGIADYPSKLELGWHVSTTSNPRDAIETVEQAIAESERLAGRPLIERLIDPATGETRPIAVVTDNGPCFKSVPFAAYIDRRPELIHIRTRRKSRTRTASASAPSARSSTSTSTGTRSTAATSSCLEVEIYRQLFNQVRPYEGIGLRRPLDVHLEAIDSEKIFKSTEPATLPLS